MIEILSSSHVVDVVKRRSKKYSRMEVDLMAEACKELGPEAMYWAEQAELENPSSGSYTLNYPQINYNPSAYDALGYSQVYSSEDYESGSFINTQYNDATMSFDPVQEYNYNSAPGNNQVHLSLEYEQSQNIGCFSSPGQGEPVYTPSSQNEYQQLKTHAAQYQYHPTTLSLPRQKQTNVLENAVSKELQYNVRSRVDHQPAEGTNAVFTDYQGRETRVNLGKGRYSSKYEVLLEK